MDPFPIRFPTAEEEERSRRFTVHRNYLASLDLFLRVLYGDGDALPTGLLAAQRALPAYQRVMRRPLLNRDELKRLLNISWASELQLRLAGVGGDAFLRYSNTWAPIQAYYAVYMSIHAWLVTVGMGGLLDDHTSTLRTAVSHIVGRGLIPHPWQVACRGCPELGERVITGLPDGAGADRHIELLANPDLADFYPRLAKMLETTRQVRLERLKRAWLRQTGRQRMFAVQKREIADHLHPTTFFDYLWRIRIRANYGDVSSVLLSGVDDRAHSLFHRSLVTVTAATCLLIQSLIVAQVGPQPYAQAVDDFTQGGGIDLGGPASFLLTRRDLLTPNGEGPTALAVPV